jgi:quinol monooxygenase YgiN
VSTPEQAQGTWEQESPRGAPLDVVYIDWHVHPFRAERWYEIWEAGAARAMAFGAKGWSLTRNVEDPLHFRQASVWEDREDFERYWYSDEISALREEAVNFYNKPVLPVWHVLTAGE